MPPRPIHPFVRKLKTPQPTPSRPKQPRRRLIVFLAPGFSLGFRFRHRHLPPAITTPLSPSRPPNRRQVTPRMFQTEPIARHHRYRNAHASNDWCVLSQQWLSTRAKPGSRRNKAPTRLFGMGHSDLSMASMALKARWRLWVCIANGIVSTAQLWYAAAAQFMLRPRPLKTRHQPQIDPNSLVRGLFFLDPGFSLGARFPSGWGLDSISL